MSPQKVLMIPIETFIQRIAWLEWQGQHIEAAALRDLTAWFVPPFYVDEQAVLAQIAELQRQDDKPPRRD